MMSYEKVSQAKNLIIGTKQTVKALRTGNANAVIIALDADSNVTSKVIDAANEFSVPIDYVDSMRLLGKACKIDVGAAAVVIMK